MSHTEKQTLLPRLGLGIELDRPYGYDSQRCDALRKTNVTNA